MIVAEMMMVGVIEVLIFVPIFGGGLALVLSGRWWHRVILVPQLQCTEVVQVRPAVFTDFR